MRSETTKEKIQCETSNDSSFTADSTNSCGDGFPLSSFSNVILSNIVSCECRTPSVEINDLVSFNDQNNVSEDMKEQPLLMNLLRYLAIHSMIHLIGCVKNIWPTPFVVDLHQIDAFVFTVQTFADLEHIMRRLSPGAGKKLSCNKLDTNMHGLLLLFTDFNKISDPSAASTLTLSKRKRPRGTRISFF